MGISPEDAAKLGKESTVAAGKYAPAATVGSGVAHPTPPVLTGQGSSDVFIGGQPAWRGVPGATSSSQIDNFIKQKKDSDEIVIASKMLPYEQQQVIQDVQVAYMVGKIVQLIASSPNTDRHKCETPWPPVLHGEGIVLQGSETVFINGCRACRQGEQVFEPIGLPNNVSKGVPTVLIGG